MHPNFSGDKIACFAPENFTDGQVGAVNEYCWNNGYWVGPDVQPVKALYTQPHRFYAFYLAVQAIVCLSPTILWNILTKSRLLAVLRGTEEFLENLVESIEQGTEEDTDPEELEEKVKGQLRQFHNICMNASKESNLSYILIGRQLLELFLYLMFLGLQLLVFDYNNPQRIYHCVIAQLTLQPIMCTVPVLDLLDFIWLLTIITLVIALIIVFFFIQGEVRAYFGLYLPLFFEDLPYGDETDFHENVVWENNAIKHSYELLTMIYEENATIMTKVYVLNAMKPQVPKASSSGEENTDTSDEERVEEVKRAIRERAKFRMT